MSVENQGSDLDTATLATETAADAPVAAPGDTDIADEALAPAEEGHAEGGVLDEDAQDAGGLPEGADDESLPEGELDGRVNAELGAVQEQVLQDEAANDASFAPETEAQPAAPAPVGQKRPETLDELIELVMQQQTLLERIVHSINDLRGRHAQLATYTFNIPADDMTLDALGLGLIRRQDNIQKLLRDEKLWDDIVKSLDIEMISADAPMTAQYCRAQLVSNNGRLDLTLFRPVDLVKGELVALNYDESLFNKRLYQRVHEITVKWHDEGLFQIHAETGAVVHMNLNGWTEDILAKYYEEQKAGQQEEAPAAAPAAEVATALPE